jgi:hypothetical protein
LGDKQLQRLPVDQRDVTLHQHVPPEPLSALEAVLLRERAQIERERLVAPLLYPLQQKLRLEIALDLPLLSAQAVPQGARVAAQHVDHRQPQPR